jgi:cystathionine beta-lyase
LSAIRARLDHGVLGYAHPSATLSEVTASWLAQAYGWSVRPEWLVWLPGLVTGLNVACRAVDGGVLTQTPVYPPFLSAPRHAGRSLVRVPLAQDVAGRWRMDIEALEAACAPDTRLLLFCHPANPVGRAWDSEELRALADVVRRHRLVVCSDEIHCDLVLDEDRRHLPLALVAPELRDESMTFMAPSKIYNVPGLATAFAIIPGEGLRQRFLRAMAGIVPHANVLGLAACEALYRDADGSVAAWRRALLDVLRSNRDCLERVVATLPGVRMTHVEATYLAWLDVRALLIPSAFASAAEFFEAQGLGLSDGADFGAPGWLRFNFGCAPAFLKIALERLRDACSTLARV